MKEEIKHDCMVLVIIVQAIIILIISCYLLEVLKAGEVLTLKQFLILD